MEKIKYKKMLIIFMICASLLKVIIDNHYKKLKQVQFDKIADQFIY